MSVAFNLNDTIGPVIDGMVAIMPTMLSFIVSIVPVVITLAFCSFFIQFPEKILAMIKF